MHKADAKLPGNDINLSDDFRHVRYLCEREEPHEASFPVHFFENLGLRKTSTPLTLVADSVDPRRKHRRLLSPTLPALYDTTAGPYRHTIAS